MNLKMKCDKDTLLNAVNIVLKAVPSKTTMDILGCILIIAEDTGFRLMSNDLEMGIETNLVEAEIESPGSIAVEAKLFSEFLRSLSDEVVSVECKENKVVYIKSGKTEFKLKGRDEKEFPRIDLFNNNSELDINSQILKDMIRKTIFSVSTDESRPIFTGELFRISDGNLSIVSADIYRLSLIKVPVEFKNTDDFVVPAKTLNELIKILPETDELINILLSDTQVLFASKDFRMVSRLINGEFINYEKVFPEESNTKVKIDRNILIKSLERASILSKEDKKNPVKIVVNAEMMIITSNTGISDFYEEISVETSGEEITIGFNPRYILEALRAIDDEYVIIALTSALSPCVITAEENELSKYMILPLKLK